MVVVMAVLLSLVMSAPPSGPANSMSTMRRRSAISISGELHRPSGEMSNPLGRRGVSSLPKLPHQKRVLGSIALVGYFGKEAVKQSIKNTATYGGIAAIHLRAERKRWAKVIKQFPPGDVAQDSQKNGKAQLRFRSVPEWATAVSAAETWQAKH